MQTTSQKNWLTGICLLLLVGCSMSRGNLARNDADGPDSQADQLSDSKSASIDDTDGPPSQPGVKQPGSTRKKLAGWLNNVVPKRESIPLERTDSNSTDDPADLVADEDSGFWKHNNASAPADDPKLAKSKSADASEENPFEE